MARLASPVMEELGLRVNLRAPVASLSLEQRQLREIARALMINPRVLILDEPTSALHIHQTERLHNLLRALRQRNVAVVYVSHILEDALNLCDVVTVLRDGERVLDAVPAAQLGIDEIVRLMLGEQVTPNSPRNSRTPPLSSACAAHDGAAPGLDVVCRLGALHRGRRRTGRFGAS